MAIKTKRTMRDIKYIVAHCTATSRRAKITSIQRYWKDELGWRNPGYHFIIEDNGEVTQLQPLDKPSNGVKGYNANSIHISWIGGKEINDISPAQKIALTALIKALSAVYTEAEILGHRDFPGVSKACPRFDTKTFLNLNQI